MRPLVRLTKATLKHVLLLNWLFLFVLPTIAQDDIPYIYYYSGALNGVVIEHADGTDSRIIGQRLVDENVLFVYGPGWSPDGRWFAWRVLAREGYYNFGKGYVASADGQTALNLLADFPCVNSMLWHPTENILLVRGTMTKRGNICPNGPYPVTTYWLIDVETQTLLATFSINSPPESDWYLPLVYWFPEEQQVQFFKLVISNRGHDTRYFLVTMSYDGTVTMEPISEDEAYAEHEGIKRYIDDDTLTLFTSWTEATAERTITPPPNSSAVGSAVSGQWDSSGNWLLIGYEFCVSDCSYVTGRVSIFNPETGYSREISDCGEQTACVGWLPERVNIAELPPGRPTSVLPSPQAMDYYHVAHTESAYSYFRRLPDVATHELVCNMDVSPPVLSLVRNQSTGEVDFVIPNGGSCGEPVQFEPELIFPTKPVVFALSPDGQYYAITDGTEYTSLYDAETGERIATLNFFGIELSFSQDSRHLITAGRFATATWDVETLVAESLNDQSVGD
jgi:hypothetical protein